MSAPDTDSEGRKLVVCDNGTGVSKKEDMVNH